jgi:hypothetical protein
VQLWQRPSAVAWRVSIAPCIYFICNAILRARNQRATTAGEHALAFGIEGARLRDRVQERGGNQQ